jgi:peptidoglycan-associated lipoprotein
MKKELRDGCESLPLRFRSGPPARLDLRLRLNKMGVHMIDIQGGYAMNRKLLLVVSSIAAAALLAGCRHAAKPAAPVVAPAAKAPAAAMSETRVPSPARDFQPAKPEAPAPAAPQLSLRDAFFPFDSATMTPDSQKNLQATADWLRAHAGAKVRIEGHCDERGTEQYKLALGDKRAWDAKEYLVALGIDPQRLSTISYGKDKPFALGHDEEAWAKNRRAHVVATTASK